MKRLLPFTEGAESVCDRYRMAALGDSLTVVVQKRLLSGLAARALNDKLRQAVTALDKRECRPVREPGPIRKILTHLGEPLEPPPVSPARGPPTDWGELVQIHGNRDVFQPSPDELPSIDIHSL